MAYLDNWRSSIPSALAKFMPQMGRKGVDLKTGVLAAAVLWYPRDAMTNPEARQALIDLCGSEPLHYLLRALPLDADSELANVQMLMQYSANRPLLREAVDTLINTFIAEIVAANILKISEQQPAPNEIRIDGDVSGGNVNIGGVQYSFGTVTHNYYQQVREVIRTCPKPPNPPENFGGREAHYQHLKQQLQAGETSAIAGVQGVGGIGKTTLARQLAHDLYREQHFKAVVWTDVNQTPDTRRLLVQWGSYGDTAYAPDGNLSADDIKAGVQHLLEQAIATACNDCDAPHVLVVLDDVWDDGIATARTLLDIKPRGATVLVTTRSKQVARLLDIKSDNLNTLPYMDNEDAARMIADYLPDVRKEDAVELAQALDGHPQAIRLAIMYVQSVQQDRSGYTLASAMQYCIKEYQRGIPADSSFNQLQFELSETDREHNLTKSLRLSYDALDETDKKHFRSLGILLFDTPFDVALLASLWEVAPEEVEQYCARLTRLGLMEKDENNRIGWYRQHRLLRAVARALLRETGETDSVFMRYAETMIRVAESFNKLPPEEWHNLNDQIPHIHNVGDELLIRFKSELQPDKWLLEHMMSFALNIVSYLVLRREVLYV